MRGEKQERTARATRASRPFPLVDSARRCELLPARRRMRSVWITRTGPPEVLEVRDGPDPVPGPGQILVRVRAAGVNFADVMARLGFYPDAPPRPCVVGYEVAGTVEQVGSGADGGLTAGRPGGALPRLRRHPEAGALPAAPGLPPPGR